MNIHHLSLFLIPVSFAGQFLCLRKCHVHVSYFFMVMLFEHETWIMNIMNMNKNINMKMNIEKETSIRTKFSSLSVEDAHYWMADIADVFNVGAHHWNSPKWLEYTFMNVEVWVLFSRLPSSPPSLPGLHIWITGILECKVKPGILKYQGFSWNGINRYPVEEITSLYTYNCQEVKSFM